MELNFCIWRPHFRFEPEEIELENLASSGEEKSGEEQPVYNSTKGFFCVLWSPGDIELPEKGCGRNHPLPTSFFFSELYLKYYKTVICFG